MFGYVTVHKPELKIKDYAKYSSYYCGLCRTLRKEYGVMGQITLTYDMTFAIILLTSLYETDTKSFKKSCIAHPIVKRDMLENEWVRYGADMNVLLAYYHLEDDWRDEKSIKGIAGVQLLKGKVKKIEALYPRQSSVIKEKLKELGEHEKNNNKNIDIVAGCFGDLMGELFVCRKDHWESILRRIGFYLGKFIYIMDAFDDIEKDIKKQNYNPLIGLYQECGGNNDSFQYKSFDMLQMMMAECSEEFEKLPCLMEVDILRNILYDGVWTRYHARVKMAQSSRENAEE